MSTMTVLYRSITEADIEELLSDPRSSAMSRGDQFEVRDTLQARVDQLTEQNRELLEALQDAVDSMASMQREVDNLIDYAGGTGGYGEHNEDIKRILAIIRKATGEEA